MKGNMSFSKMVMAIFVVMVILAMVESGHGVPFCCGWNPDCCQASLQKELPRQMKFIPSNT